MRRWLAGFLVRTGHRLDSAVVDAECLVVRTSYEECPLWQLHEQQLRDGLERRRRPAWIHAKGEL